MSDQLLVATRKGLFTISRGGGDWSVTNTAFLADNCTLVMHDPRTAPAGAGRRLGSPRGGGLGRGCRLVWVHLPGVWCRRMAWRR